MPAVATPTTNCNGSPKAGGKVYFAGISNCPRLDELLMEEAMHRLECGGVDQFALVGCKELGLHPWFEADSQVAYGIVNHVIAEAPIFRFADTKSREWAARRAVGSRQIDLVAVTFSPLAALDPRFRHDAAQKAERLSRSLLDEASMSVSDWHESNTQVLQSSFLQDVAAAVELLAFLTARAEQQASLRLVITRDELLDELGSLKNHIGHPDPELTQLLELCSRMLGQRLRQKEGCWILDIIQEERLVCITQWLPSNQIVIELSDITQPVLASFESAEEY